MKLKNTSLQGNKVKKLFVPILMIFVLSGVCLADGLDDGPPSFFGNIFWGNPTPPGIPAPPVVQPETSPVPVPQPPDPQPVIDTPEAETPFLNAFLIVYDGKWIAVFNDGIQRYSVGISRKPCTCNVDETQCCGVLKASRLNSDTILFNGSFCLSSTYEIHIKDAGNNIMCMGVKGAKIESPLHPSLPGFTWDDPVFIDCGFFRLVRPE